jgi:hypothetical protein
MSRTWFLALALCAAQAALAAPCVAQAQEREAQSADALAFEDAAQYLRGALLAIRTGRPAQATELLERAEARLLTRAAPTRAATRPVARGPVADITAARAAVARNDLAAAQPRAEKALAELERRQRPRRAPTG